MTHGRPHRKAVSEKEALEEIMRGAGSQFDSEMVKVFEGIISERKPSDFKVSRREVPVHIKKQD
ncbi:MAG: hypothetical protein HPY52_10870 [Firmicutes bacterium]|nr:hypothetical protein [Bacillota bacterium]